MRKTSQFPIGNVVGGQLEAEAATEAVAAAEQEHVLIIGRKQTTVRFIPLVKCQAEGKA